MVRFFIEKPVTRLFIILLVYSGILFSRNTKGTSFYVKSEFLTESNIFEDTTETQSLGNQLWLGFSHKYNSSRQILSLKLVSNLSCYEGHKLENKALNIFTTNYSYSIHKRVSFQSNLEFYNKQWYKNNYGYMNSRINSGLNYSTRKSDILFSGEYQYNHFPNFNVFTSECSGMFIQLRHVNSSNYHLSFKSSWHSICYTDRLVGYSSASDSSNSPLQKDKLMTYQIGIEKRQKQITGIRLRYIVNTSNDSSADFRAVTGRLYCSQKILGIYTHLIVDFQLKNYDNPDGINTIINPDPEQNIQNQILLGLDKPLNSQFSIQGKIAYIYNETIYSECYYDKWFFSLGVRYTMPVKR